MKATSKTLAALAAICVATAPSPSFADTVTADAAKTAVAGWVNLRQSMDGGTFSAPESAKAYSGADGKGMYYVVSLSGGGYVVTSGDTFLKPVLSYAASGAWEENEAKNPLVLFVKCDVAASAAAMPVAGSAVASANAAEWAKLAAAASQKSGSRRLAATAPTADLRVSPLLTTAWAQGSVDGKLCYNYYTPGNYVCGCVATALAQVMKYFRYPTGKVTAGEWYYDSVNYNGTDKGYDLDGYFASATATTKTPWSPAFGGPYNWDAMVDAPTGSTSETARKAIGQLCRDAAITVFSHFNVNNGGETSGYSGTQASALVKTFGFAGATASPYNENALLASLDAGLPAVMELSGNGGHGVVADGYGYDDGGTLYVHFNFGWGDDNSGRWYTPPSVAAFTSISRMIAAIFTPAQGTRGSSVISGRVLDANGSPVSGATVTAKNAAGAVVATKTSNAKGIYAFILPAGVYRLAAESGSNKSERLCTVESTESPLRPNDGWGGENTVNHSRSGIDLAFGQTTGLMHRWSFNGTTDEENLTDSVGGVVAKKMKKTSNTTTVEGGTVNWTNGKATLPGGTGTGFLNLGEGVLGAGKTATLEAWVTRNAKNTAWGYIISYSIPDSTANLLTISPASGSDITRSCVEWSGSGQKNDVLVGQPIGVTYHYAITFDGSRTRIMVRNAETGFLLREYSLERSGWSLASAASDGCALTLGNNPFTNGRYDVPYSFDEVRVWNGVLCDDQLTASVLAGPDNVVGGEQEAFAIDAGKTFTVPATVGGYGFLTDKIALLGAGSKIRFDTTDYFGTGLRFKAGGFAIPSGSVLDYVELSDPENYTATMEDANTILVRLKPTIPYESTWSGGTPATAADLANAAKWTSVNAAGEAISAAPGSKTTVVIPAASLAAFAIPSGTSLNWGRVLLGGRTKAKYGFKDGVPDNATTTWRDLALSGYTTVSDIPNGKNDISYLTKSSGNLPSECGTAQIRLDGWFYVRSDQAGKWTLPNKFDDLGAFAIDGVWLYILNTYRVDSNGGTFVSEGWHRYTIVVGDTSGNWGSSLSLNGASVPFAVSINGGSNIAFSDANFTFGSDADTVALSGDADWRALGAIVLDSGLTIDLNGHSLSFMSVASTHVGATLKNTSSSAARVSGSVDSSVVVDGNVLISSGLAHRWTFNSDFTDSVGGSDAVTMKNDTAKSSIVGGTASISGGKAVLPGGNQVGYLNLGAGVLGEDDATLEFWATRTADQNQWMYLATYGIPESSSGDFVTMAVSCGSGDNARHGKLQGKFGDSSIFVGMPKGVLYHVSATFTKNANGSTTIRWMIRDGKTGFLLSETSKTASNWTLADAKEAGWMLTLGNNPFDNGWTDLACEIDDVRVWHGVLSDEQLLLNAVAGPDAPGSGAGDTIVLGGTIAASTPGGYGFATDSQVMIASGAKIVFDTANYNGTALRFKTGGFILPAGVSSVLDLVELTDAENFTATTEDGGNTIKVSLKSTMPLTSVWKGGTPSTAADLANAANWESTNADGTTINAAPGSRTTVIIPANKLAAFTIPADVTASLDWGRVLLGGYTVTTIGNKAAAPNPRISEYRDYALSQYTVLSDTGIDYANGNNTTFQQSYLKAKQLRFDGWVYVDETQAGRWNLASSFDDVLSFAIDGKWIFLRPKWEPAMTAGCFVSAGWHRFTLVEADTGGGFGCNNVISNTKVPFSISINGGAAVAFHSAFTFGTEAPSVTLDADRNWAAMGPVTFENGLTIDLNGHNLTLAGGTSDYVGAKIVNSDTSADSTIYTYSGTIDTSLTSGSAGTVNVSSVPPVEAYWTGAGGTGLANDHRNWNCYSAANKSGLLPGALPMSSTLVVMDTAPASTVVDGDVLNWYQMKLGSAGKGYLAIEEGGSLSTVGWGTVGLTKNYSGQIDQTGGSLRSGTEFSVGENGTGVYNQSGGSSYYTGTLYIGRNSNAGVGTYNLSGGTLDTSDNAEFQVGSNGKGTFNQTAGSVKAGNWFSIGRVAGTGVYNISGGSLTTAKTNRPLWLGGDNASGVGTLNISGTAVVNFNGGVDAGRSNQSHGYLNQDGGSLTVSNGDGFNIARDSYATYVQNAGDLVVNCVTRIAWGTGTAVGGTYKLNGGTATFKNDFYVGVGRLGTFAQSGGTMTANNGVKIANGSSATGYFNMSGGILNTPSIQGVSGVASVVLDGGTIVAKNASDGAFFSGIDSLVVGGGAIDTDGHDLSVTADAVRVIDGGKAFTKAGEGTLTFPAMPASDTVTVEAGALALAAGANNVAPAAPALTGPTHRWSFNNSYNDSVTGAAPASRFGTTSGKTTPLTITPGKLVLNGGGGWGNGSLSLGVSSLGSADATVEIWAGNDAIVDNSVLFSYSDQNWGTAPKNEVCFKWSEGKAATDVMWVKKAGTDIFKENAVLSQVVLGKEYYFAFTFHDNGDGSALISWQRRDAATGALERSGRRVVPGWTLANVASSTNPTFAIGVYKNNVAGDAKASYNEVRVWGAALSDDALALSAQKGPDATAADIAAIVAKNGEVADRTLAIASGATLDLGGNTLTQPVLAGAGTVQNGTLTVTKKIRVNADEKLTFSGVTLDVTGTTVEVADPENLTQPFVFAESTTAITGKPSSGVRGWKVKKSADGRTLTFKRVRGVMVIVN